jgi:cation diffusion facilitator family transporter
VTPQRRTALASIVAAVVLIAIKLSAGVASGSLGLVSEAVHSGTDLVAALLTFFALGYAVKPADAGHQFGHGKAEHLAALAEASVLAVLSVGIAVLAGARLAGWVEIDVDAAWWAFAAAGFVIAIDLYRAALSYRAASRHRSPALAANALHFAGDFVGTTAVLVGLVCVRAGWPEGDSIAALAVSALVLLAAARLMRRNVDVLMDVAPADAVEAAREAIDALEPPVELRRLRMRHAGGRDFADVVIGVSPGAAVGQGHADADRVERAVERALPGSDVVVHVEPGDSDATLRERVRAAAMTVSRVREIHNLSVIDLTGGGLEASLHLKLPGELPLEEAHAIAEQVEREIEAAVPELSSVQTHLEPLQEQAEGREARAGAETVARVVREATGAEPRATRVLRTEDGLVVFLTLALDAATPLAEAHDRAGAVAARVRAALPDVADVIVHTEP